MKQQHFITIALLVAAACNTEDYYRNANVPPELTASVDVDRIDTIKTSAASSRRTYTMSITATDENRNMSLLQVVAPTGSVKIDGVATDQQAIETTKERADFTRSIEFTPNHDGLHLIAAKVTDDFNTSRSVEKRVHSFTNMRPKVGVTYNVQRINPTDLKYTLDFSTSYDRDKKWGGGIDTLFVRHYSQNAYDDFGEDFAWGYMFAPVADFGQGFDAYLYDDGFNWYTDMWLWVKDNEGAVSDTVHFSIGHVE